MTDQLLFEMDGAVAWITMNRPDALNALTTEMMQALGDALDRCADDQAVRAIVLTGAGERAFCAGGDVKGMASRNSGGPALTLDDRIHALHDDMRRTSLRLHTHPKPTIASVNGYAMGAGLSLALAC